MPKDVVFPCLFSPILRSSIEKLCSVSNLLYLDRFMNDRWKDSSYRNIKGLEIDRLVIENLQIEIDG